MGERNCGMWDGPAYEMRGKAPQVCPFCKKVFRDPDKLVQHLLEHMKSDGRRKKKGR